MAAGRPLKYETPEEMQALIDLYFKACRVNKAETLDVSTDSLLEGLSDDDLLVVDEIDDVFPTITGLSLVLDLTRKSLLNYEGREEFLPTVKRAKAKVEASLEQRLFYNNPTGTIFNLKNNFEWKDKTEQSTNHSGALGVVDLSGKSDEELKSIINGTTGS